MPGIYVYICTKPNRKCRRSIAVCMPFKYLRDISGIVLPKLLKILILQNEKISFASDGST